ncbi:MAG: hypothetical protein KF901_24935 [Myxococcales bacterium]|nr:hypothetical protein [Myxococcales bacterium]
MSDLLLGLVLGYLAGTAGMFLTFYFARLASGSTERRRRLADVVTANGIPAPR